MNAYTNPAPHMVALTTTSNAARPGLCYPVAGALVVAPESAPRPAEARRSGPGAEECRGCGGTGYPYNQDLPWCPYCTVFPVSVPSPEPPLPTVAYRVEPGGVIPVYPLGSVWAAAAEILAAVFDHWHLLTRSHVPGGQSAAWLRQAAGDLFHLAPALPFRPDTELSASWLRGQLADDALDAEQAGLLSFLAALVAEAFGPTGLALPRVAR